MTVMLRADEIRWSLADSDQPAACRMAEDVGPPSGLTASRADLVIWWRWWYAVLEAEVLNSARIAGKSDDEIRSLVSRLHAYRDAIAA